MPRTGGSDSQTEVLMAQPGPGGVLQFADEVNGDRRESNRLNGIRSALRWVLGESNEHPVTSTPVKGISTPPTMSEIKRAQNKARIAQRKARQTGARVPRGGFPAHEDYYTGVRECLRWISRGGTRPRRS